VKLWVLFQGGTIDQVDTETLTDIFVHEGRARAEAERRNTERVARETSMLQGGTKLRVNWWFRVEDFEVDEEGAPVCHCKGFQWGRLGLCSGGIRSMHSFDGTPCEHELQDGGVR
jgi:hypothetical protein